MKKISPKYLAGRGLVQSRIPADQINQQLSQNEAKTLLTNAPYVDACVVSTYGARPINAVDFETYGNFSNIDSFSDLSITVPAGKIAVVQNFTIDMFIPELFMDIYGFYASVPSAGVFSFLVDNIGVENYTNVQQGFKIIRHPIYIVASEGKIITLRVNTGFNASGNFALYGQFLQASGRSANFEPGTEFPLPIRVKESKNVI